jgi:hypothetical protein
MDEAAQKRQGMGTLNTQRNRTQQDNIKHTAYLLVQCLFNDAFSSKGHTAPHGRMKDGLDRLWNKATEAYVRKTLS